MVQMLEQKSRPTVKQRVTKLNESMQGSQAWNSIFRPGSIFRKGYSDSPRNRSYVVMNSVLYHLHPVKVKRHAVKVSYTLCLGGLSFFLFILLTITGIFLMFFYRPTSANAWQDIQSLHTSVTFGLMVRNMHRWGAHLMVLTVFLHMARVFYHGAYKAPREFNWVIGVILLTLTLLLSFTGYLLPWDQLALWAVTVGTNMMGYSPVIGSQVRFVLLGGVEIGPETLLRWYVLHVLLFPFVTVHRPVRNLRSSGRFDSLRSKNGANIIAIIPMPGIVTPAIIGWNIVKSSCNPRKYQGALEGLGVRLKFAACNNGALTNHENINTNAVQANDATNSTPNKCGQVCTLSTGTALTS